MLLITAYNPFYLPFKQNCINKEAANYYIHRIHVVLFMCLINYTHILKTHEIISEKKEQKYIGLIILMCDCLMFIDIL